MKKIVNHLPLSLKVQFSDVSFSWTKALALDLNAEPRIITKSN